MILSVDGRGIAAHLAAGVLLALASVSARADDYGNTAATASPINVNVLVNGFIETGTDSDYFSFYAIAGSQMKLNGVKLSDIIQRETAFNPNIEQPGRRPKPNVAAVFPIKIIRGKAKGVTEAIGI